jgi:hypothetical protein
MDPIEEAAWDLTSVAEEHGGRVGMGALYARYGLDEAKMHASSLELAQKALRQFPPEQHAVLLAGLYEAGIMLGLRMAEGRS